MDLGEPSYGGKRPPRYVIVAIAVTTGIMALGLIVGGVVIACRFLAKIW